MAEREQREGLMLFDDGRWTIIIDGAVVFGPGKASECGTWCRENNVELRRTMQREQVDFSAVLERARLKRQRRKHT